MLQLVLNGWGWFRLYLLKFRSSSDPLSWYAADRLYLFVFVRIFVPPGLFKHNA